MRGMSLIVLPPGWLSALVTLAALCNASDYIVIDRNHSSPHASYSFVKEVSDIFDCNNPFSTCKSTTETIMQITALQSLLATNITRTTDLICNCDDHCHAFRDCCADVADLGNYDDVTHDVMGIPIEMWRCLPLHIGNSTRFQTINMVASCPLGHDFSSQCSKSDLATASMNYILDVPVMDALSGVWFRNIYCALCHGVEDNLAPVNMTLECSKNLQWEEIAENATYQGSLMWEYNDSNFGSGICHLRVAPYDWKPINNGIWYETSTNPGFYRECKTAVSTCPITWEDDEVRTKCQSYAQYYDSFDENSSNVYKNPHCAYCNKQDSNLHCTDFLSRNKPDWKPTSLSIVFNNHWNFRENVFSKRNSKSCVPPFGLYDALNDRCHHFRDMCVDNTVCKQSNGNLTISCPKTYLSTDKFQLIENGSSLKYVDHELLDVIIARGHFEILENGTASVCLHDKEEQREQIQEEISLSAQVEGILTFICLSISVVCLLLHIATYMTVPKLRNLPGKNLVALAWCLVLAQFLFMVGVRPVVEISPGLCISTAILIHFFYLAAFFWMNVMSFDIWRKFSAPAMYSSSSINLHRKYAVYAWTVPAAVVLISALVDILGLLPVYARPNYGTGGICWIGSPLGQGIFFAAPALLIIIANVFFFSTTVIKIYLQMRESALYMKNQYSKEIMQTKTRNQCQSDSIENGNIPAIPGTIISGNRDHNHFFLYMKLFLIMGLTWIFGFVNAWANVSFLWYPFIVLNGLQGAFIFFVFDLKKSVAVMMWEEILVNKYQVPEFLKASKCVDRSKSENTSSGATRLRKISNWFSSTTSSGLMVYAVSTLPADSVNHVETNNANQMIPSFKQRGEDSIF